MMDGKSLNIAEEKLNALRKVIPEAFTENKIDWEKLKASLGEDIEFKNERYVLNWAGKSDAFRVLQSPTTATLVPAKDESVNFDTTGNIFIEGENLEVLKVLQKSYFGQIKMIYIDPPYNTGNDNFIYPDKFSETKEEYLSRIGDKDESGYLTREGLFRKNSKDSGHYHSNWLSMMYPRLFLARNLLRDDGVIFISIDDNEVHNLRMLMNEVFGEENFVGKFVWRKKVGAGADSKLFFRQHEYILLYAKNIDLIIHLYQPLNKKQLNEYSNPDDDLRGDWAATDLSSPAHDNDPKRIYEVVSPSGKTYKKCWSYTKENFNKLVENNLVWWGSNNNLAPKRKRFLKDKKGLTPRSWIDEYLTQDGKKDIESIDFKIFDYPKPVFLIKRFLEIGAFKQSLILDFFSGSATTAHAVLYLNKEDGGNRKFIMVQLPEKTDEKSEAYKAGYKTIAEIGKERIRRVIKKIKDEQSGKLDLEGNHGKQDLGFKVFKLRESNFKIWRTKIETEEELVEQMQEHIEPLDKNAKTENVMYELLLKSGVPLTAKIEKEDGFYLVSDSEIALILEKVDKDIIKSVITKNPRKVITLDRLFNKNDQLKTNTALQMKDARIEFKVV